MDTTNFNLQLTSRRLSTAVNVASQSHRRRPLMTQRPKASNFSFTSIAIGPTWRRVSRREGDLTAKLYFAKRILIWEFLEGAWKSKIEVKWSDITAIHARMPPNHPGTLRIELGKTPSFFQEIKSQPSKHTKWEKASDFTDGHALLHRIHCVIFPHGELDKHYQKLLQYDQYLFELSQKPFPSPGVSPYFNTSFNNPTPLTSSPSLNPVVSSDDHRSMSYNEKFDFNGGGACSSSQFNHIHNNPNPNLYGVTHVDQEMRQIIAAHHPRPPALEGSNFYGGVSVEQRPELINNNNFALNCLPPPILKESNFYDGVMVEQRPELIDNNNFALNCLPPFTLEDFNCYGGVTVEQQPQLVNNINFRDGVTVEQRPESIDNTNFALNKLPPFTFEDFNCYGGVTVEQQPQLNNNTNFYGGVTVEQRPELIDSNNFALNCLPPFTLEDFNCYGGVTVEQQPQLVSNINFYGGITVEQRAPELIDNNNFALKRLPPFTLEDFNCYGGVTVEQQPQLNNNINFCDGVPVEQRPKSIDNTNFALNRLPPFTLEDFNFYGGVTVDLLPPQLINNNNLGNDREPP